MTVDPFSLKDRTALVTGASGGLGAHFASVLAAAGATVAVAARRADKVADVVTGITGAGGKAIAVAMDVTDADSIAGALNTIESEAGPVTIVVNNAGIAGGGAAALDVKPEKWQEVIDTNLSGVWSVAQAAAGRMVAAGTGGSIINIASILGLRVSSGVAAYAVSKAGVIQMTKALALEWARHGVRVNAIAPGYFKTDMTRDYLESEAVEQLIKVIPQRRTGDLSDLDGPLLLLASDAGAYMTGAVIPVDGGHLVSSL